MKLIITKTIRIELVKSIYTKAIHNNNTQKQRLFLFRSQERFGIQPNLANWRSGFVLVSRSKRI